MENWRDGAMLGFDTETTGTNVLEDRIVSVALVERCPGRDDQVFTWLIDPGVEIPPVATKVHGITTDMARSHGEPADQAIESVAQRIAQCMASDIPVVAFNASFDLNMIENELARHNLPTLRTRLGRMPGPIIDPLVIDRAKDRFRKGPRKLADMCETYGLEPREDFHSAKGDVIATLDLLGKMLEVFPELANDSLQEMQEWQSEVYSQWAADFNNWLEFRKKDAVPAPTWWPLPDEDDGPVDFGKVF